jgi:hypothetical protein
MALSAVALALVAMLPRLASPEFGLLDDGLTLQTGREVIGRWWSVVHLIPDTGRFFPAYWFAYAVVFAVVGARPLAFFAVNVLILAGLVATLMRVIQIAGGSRLQMWVAAVLLAACGPSVEAFYTLSKAEPLQMMWIGIALLATARSAAPGRRAWRTGLIALAASALALAYATKETSVALMPVCLGWLAIEWWSSPERGPRWRFACTFLAVNVVAAALFAWLRWSFAPLALAQGWYTRAYALNLDTVGPSLFRTSSWLIRNFAFLLLLVPIAALSRVRGHLAPRRLVSYACVWVVPWLAVYLPWPATFEYHLLPFAFGAAVLGGGIAAALHDVGHRDPSVWMRRAAWSLLGVGGLLWVMTVVNAAADARVQLAVDRANTKLVEFLANLPTGSRVLVNSPSANEYVYELPLHLAEIKRRPDIDVEHIARPQFGEPPDEVFAVSLEAANQPVPTVRVILDRPAGERADAVLAAVREGRAERVYRHEERAEVLELGFHRLLCRMARPPLIDYYYCGTGRGVIFRRTFSYRWQVHRLPQVALEARKSAGAR